MFNLSEKNAAVVSLSENERKSTTVLIVESAFPIRNQIKQTLTALGFPSIADAADHAAALQKIAERPVTHVIFDAKKTNMQPKEFLAKVLEMSPNIVAIPCSQDPSVDDVFNLLIAGARGYIVKPFTQDSLDEAINQATKGQALSDTILYAKDRNEALASLILTALDKVATIMRQAQKFETARVELPKKLGATRRAAEIGKLFAQGGVEKLLEAIVEFCLERGDGPASRLGRLRKKLDLEKGRKTNNG